MQTSRVRLLALGLGAVLALTVPLGYAVGGARPARATTGPGGSLTVEGYVLGWGGGRAAYLGDAKTVDVAGVDGVELTSDADGITHVPGRSRPVLRAAHRHHDTAELLVSNYSDSLGDFDPALAHRLLTSRDHRRHVAAALAHVVRRQGWDGIQIDLESLKRHDRSGLSAFVRALRTALPRRAPISMAVMAETSRAAYARHGYALGRLHAVRRFVLMAYDEHGPGWSGPGPIGALPWAERTARPLVEAVGAARVDLGIAGYGYLWTSPSTGHTVSDAKARSLAGSKAVWHPRAGEWSATVRGGTEWWSDGRSYRRRVVLAHHLGVHGVAVWQLTSADPLRG
ncbi:MAG: glycosyl hydrolase family 18 protein [Nocardioides sp.]